MRDDFSKRVKDVLARRAGMCCSNPRCRRLTCGPRDEPSLSVNLGVAAHITAAARGGPRFAKSLDSNERRSAKNGIWLCQNCAKLVDNDPIRYPPKLLLSWKRTSEKAVQQALETAKETPPVYLLFFTAVPERGFVPDCHRMTWWIVISTEKTPEAAEMHARGLISASRWQVSKCDGCVEVDDPKRLSEISIAELPQMYRSACAFGICGFMMTAPKKKNRA